MAEFTIIHNNGQTEYTMAASKMQVYQRLERDAVDYLEVIDGRKVIPRGAINKFRSDPMSILLSQIPSEQPKVEPKPIEAAAAIVEDTQAPAVETAQAPAVETAQPTGTEAAVPARQPELVSETPKPKRPVFETPKPIRYFETAGIQFKIEKNVIYQRMWVEADETVRIVGTKSGKMYDGTQYKSEILMWEPCQTEENTEEK